MEPSARDRLAGAHLAEGHTYPPAASAYADPARSASNGVAGDRPPPPAVQSLPHGPSRSLNTAADAIHPDLRSPQDSTTASAYPPVPSMMTAGPQPPSEQAATAAAAAALGTPSAATVGGPAPPSSPPDLLADGRRTAKRELSQSKRAAQNRAAQRAFRQRKEGYIKKLELQVQELADLRSKLEGFQTANTALRQYIAILQARLVECSGEIPPPPEEMNFSPHAHAAAAASQAPPTLSAPNYGAPPQMHPQLQPPQAPVSSAVEAAAQAVAGLVRSDGLPAAVRFEELGKYESAKYEPGPSAADRMDEDTRTAQEITQLQRESTATGAPPATM